MIKHSPRVRTFSSLLIREYTEGYVYVHQWWESGTFTFSYHQGQHATSTVTLKRYDDSSELKPIVSV